MAWLLHQSIFGCGLPREGSNLGQRGSLLLRQSLKADSQKLCTNNIPRSCGKSFTEESWPCIRWGNVTVSHFGVTFVFPSKEKKELLWIRANSRECPPWIVWLLLGPIIWPRGEYRDRYILGHAHPCGQLAVQQGTWGGSPTKPHRVKEEHFPNRRGGGAITPRRGRGYNIWLTK